jgi:hypothetical protein
VTLRGPGQRPTSAEYVSVDSGYIFVMQDAETIAQELSVLGHKLDDLDKRLGAVEQVNSRLEDAALTTARALGEISGHWDAVYKAMRRKDESQKAAEPENRQAQ